MTPDERATAPATISLEDVAAAVVELIDRGGIRTLP